MLQVEAVALRHAPVAVALHPRDLVDEPAPHLPPPRPRVAPVGDHLDGQAVLGVDHPHEQVAVRLDLRHWDRADRVVAQLLVRDRHLRLSTPRRVYASRGVGRGELPWGIHHDHIEVPTGRGELRLAQLLPVERPDVRVDRDAQRRRVVLRQLRHARLHLYASRLMRIGTFVQIVHVAVLARCDGL